MCMHHDHDAIDCPDQETKDMLNRRRMIQTLAAGGAVTASGAGLAGCATNPETGSNQLIGFVGEKALSQMAAQSWAQAKQKQPQSTDPRYLGRLRGIGQRIARGARRDKQQWDYAVFDSDTKNAFVLPGNRVGFYKGMMDFADNDDQIAAIMGHEVGHVSGRHAQERVNTQFAGQLAVAGGTILAGSQMQKNCKNQPTQYQRQCYAKANNQTKMLNQALGIGFMVGIVLPFSRKHESQSDLLGARYMHNAGYDTKQSVRLWEKMAEASPRSQPTFMSTHPDPLDRARDLHNFIECQDRMGSQGWGNNSLKAALKACKA